jgi:hypothetical protein
MRQVLIYSTYLLLFVAAQALIFERMILPTSTVIGFCALYVLLLPFQTPKILLMILGGFLGLSIDYFADTLGLYASTCVWLAFIRPTVYKYFEPAVGYAENQTPTLNGMGWNWTLKAYSICILAFCAWFYGLSFLRMIGPWFTLQKILISSASTLLIILLVQVFYQRRMQKNEL